MTQLHEDPSVDPSKVEVLLADDDAGHAALIRNNLRDVGLVNRIHHFEDGQAVLDFLFDSDGSEVYLKPAGRYIRPGESVDFYSVLEAARRRGETAIGYRVAEHAFDSSKNYGVRLNPLKTDRLAFAPADRIIVLAES